MSTTIRLAWRNLWRNKRRTSLMIGIVAVGAWAVVLFWGISEGFFSSMIHAQISLDVGDLQIHRLGYLNDPDLELALSPDQLEAIESALQDERVRSWSPRLELEGLLRSAYAAKGIQIRGIDLEREARVTTLPQAVVQGRFLENPAEVLLSRKISQEVDVRVGERIVLDVQGLTGPQARGFRVVGVFNTGLPLLDEGTVFIALQDAQSLAGIPGATGVALVLQPGVKPAMVDAALGQALGEAYGVSTFMELNPLLSDMIRVQNIEMIPMMLLVAVLAGFGVANTVMFTVLERTREFGVLIAVGMKPRRLARMVLAESALASGLGFILGGGMGYGLIVYLARAGFDLGVYSEAFPDLGMPHVIYAEASGWYWLYSFSVVVLTGMIAAWYPARRAAKLDPTEAMRHV
jgi:ABC-type lipoprotein release transport system permease subunit